MNRLVFCLVNSNLREWEVDALFVESIVNCFIHSEEHVPIVSRFNPNANSDIYAAIGEFTEADKVSGIFKDASVVSYNCFEHLANFFDVGAIVDSEAEVYTAFFLSAVIGEVTGSDRVVWDDDSFVIWSSKYSIKDLNRFYNTAFTANLYEITDFIRTKNEDNNTAGKVL